MELSKIRAAIRDAERAIVGIKPLTQRGGVLGAFTDEMVSGPILIMSGLAIIWKRLLWVVVLTVAILIYLRIFEPALNAVMVWTALGLALMCVYFGLPSRTVLAGVSDKMVHDLGIRIAEHVSNAEELKRLSSGVQPVKVQATERLARFNVFASILWGALFWFAGARLLSPSVTPDVFEASLWPTIVVALMFFVVFMAAVGYATAVRVVFQLLDFALLEVDRQLASNDGKVRLGSSRGKEAGHGAPQGTA